MFNIEIIKTDFMGGLFLKKKSVQLELDRETYISMHIGFK